jgi:hypothetical protein
LTWPADAAVIRYLTLLDLATDQGYLAPVAAIGTIARPRFTTCPWTGDGASQADLAPWRSRLV